MSSLQSLANNHSCGRTAGRAELLFESTVPAPTECKNARIRGATYIRTATSPTTLDQRGQAFGHYADEAVPQSEPLIGQNGSAAPGARDIDPRIQRSLQHILEQPELVGKLREVFGAQAGPGWDSRVVMEASAILRRSREDIEAASAVSSEQCSPAGDAESTLPLATVSAKRDDEDDSLQELGGHTSRSTKSAGAASYERCCQQS